MAEAGFIETMNFDLVDEPTLYGKFGRSAESRLEVDNPRSAEHYLLRDSLLPSLMAVLGRNTKNEYPQRIFEAGKVFSREGVGIARDALAGCALGPFLLFVHRGQEPPRGASQEALPARRRRRGRLPTGPSPREGRAEAFVKDVPLGYVGEVKPSALAAFGLDMPVCGFELDLSGSHARA